MIKLPRAFRLLTERMIPCEDIGFKSPDQSVSFASGLLPDDERAEVLTFLRDVLASGASDADLYRLLSHTRWYAPRDPAQSRRMLERYVQLVVHPIFETGD